jgi:sulfhydrogenase subunit beta (sulfur reductase)
MIYNHVESTQYQGDTKLMTRRLIEQPLFEEWIGGLISSGNLYAPQAKGRQFVFDKLCRVADLRLDYDVTLLPPKKYFHPPEEVLLKFDRQTMNFTSVFDATPFVLLGVHPYDMAAISQLDKVFSMDHADQHYLARREAATIVVCDVQRVSEHAFSGAMGQATMEGKQGHDMLLTLLDDGRYLVDAVTEKGSALLGVLADAVEADEAALQARQQVWDCNRKNLRQHELKVAPSELPGLLEKSYDHPVWAEKADLCYSCGSCNLVCPTCYCFDVEDELNWDLTTGQRKRVWDGCMLREFSAVAGGHNFRSERAARYRHRYFRKGKYSWDSYGEIACVGCGRCISACTANIANPVEIFNRLLEGEEE